MGAAWRRAAARAPRRAQCILRSASACTQTPALACSVLLLLRRAPAWLPPRPGRRAGGRAGFGFECRFLAAAAGGGAPAPDGAPRRPRDCGRVWCARLPTLAARGGSRPGSAGGGPAAASLAAAGSCAGRVCCAARSPRRVFFPRRGGQRSAPTSTCEFKAPRGLSLGGAALDKRQTTLDKSGAAARPPTQDETVKTATHCCTAYVEPWRPRARRGPPPAARARPPAPVEASLNVRQCSVCFQAGPALSLPCPAPSPLPRAAPLFRGQASGRRGPPC
ncbi:MAG: hypothetical protein J3K34DRAFT_124945 [Monoraphidium minutum]|nr:MAG: hypothetical protein J3K34DRAFT_124945 [Monoraphidium minutum]